MWNFLPRVILIWMWMWMLRWFRGLIQSWFHLEVSDFFATSVGEMKSKETKIEKRVSFVDDVEFLARKNNVKTYAEAVKPRTI